MQGVQVVDHPLVQHKLTLIRDKNRSTKSFRELLKEIGMLLCYEVTRDLPLTDVEIETPLATMMAPRIAGKKLVFAPDPARRHHLRRRHARSRPGCARRPYRALPRAGDLCGGRIFLQGADRSCRAAGHRGRAGARHRQYRGRRRRPFEGARRQGHPPRLPDLRAARHRAHARACIPTSRSGRRRSTRRSTSTPSSCPVWATPATAPTERNKFAAALRRREPKRHRRALAPCGRGQRRILSKRGPVRGCGAAETPHPFLLLHRRVALSRKGRGHNQRRRFMMRSFN